MIIKTIVETETGNQITISRESGKVYVTFSSSRAWTVFTPDEAREISSLLFNASCETISEDRVNKVKGKSPRCCECCGKQYPTIMSGGFLLASACNPCIEYWSLHKNAMRHIYNEEPIPEHILKGLGKEWSE